MVEIPKRISSEEQRDFILSRKQFLTAVAAGSASFLTKEYLQGLNDIVTPVGLFMPYYERHDIGIDAKRIEPMDIFFREGILDKAEYDADFPKLFKERVVIGGTEEEIPLLSDEIIEKLATNSTAIMLGDVPPVAMDNAPLDRRINFVIPNLVIVANLVESEIAKIKKKPMTRRRFTLKAATYTAGFASEVPLIADITSKVLHDMNIQEFQLNPLMRISERIHALESDFKPSDAIIFFRNAVWANKLLHVAELIKQDKHSLPKLGYNVGAAHAGIEDNFLIGSPLNRLLITSYPKDVLQPVVDAVGGIENFCTSKLFQLPSNFKVSDFDTQKVQLIREKRLVDTELAAELRSKLV